MRESHTPGHGTAEPQTVQLLLIPYKKEEGDPHEIHSNSYTITPFPQIKAESLNIESLPSINCLFYPNVETVSTKNCKSYVVCPLY